MCIYYIMWICTYYLQFSGSCYFSLIFIVHINIVYECIVLRCTVENILTYFLTQLVTGNAFITRRAASKQVLLTIIIIIIVWGCVETGPKFHHFGVWTKHIGLTRRYVETSESCCGQFHKFTQTDAKTYLGQCTEIDEKELQVSFLRSKNNAHTICAFPHIGSTVSMIILNSNSTSKNEYNVSLVTSLRNH